MGLITNSQRQYYQSSNLGNYQFTSLRDIIDQFMVVYVGEGKAISKASKVDVAFHAQRAMQELSFDTFKSVKSQEIKLPPTLIMPLPQDYVNYVKLTFSDDAGIKHVLYPTSKTSNPFKIAQEIDGSYDFTATLDGTIKNASFADDLLGTVGNADDGWLHTEIPSNHVDTVQTDAGRLKIKHDSYSYQGQGRFSNAFCVWQRLEITDMVTITIGAYGLSAEAKASIPGGPSATNDLQKDAGIIRFGVTSREPSSSNSATTFDATIASTGDPACRNDQESIFNLTDINGNRAMAEFNDGAETFSTKTIEDIDVSSVPPDASGKRYIWFIITSFIPNFTGTALSNSSTNQLDNITFETVSNVDYLQDQGQSTTWSNYKSHKPSENNINDYQDYQNHIYWPNEGERYGLDPQHAQINGSFYIDELRGNIHFSSPLSGKTIILEYISDGLGTDEEMKVHKFAEEAMYRSIAFAIISASSYGQSLVRRYKKEKFAAVRQAKLRLSNIKLEEITQIFRGKSKQIKH